MLSFCCSSSTPRFQGRFLLYSVVTSGCLSCLLPLYHLEAVRPFSSDLSHQGDNVSSFMDLVRSNRPLIDWQVFGTTDWCQQPGYVQGHINAF